MPMRISFLLSSLWLSGGVLLVIDYANRLSQRGHDVTLVSPGGAIDPAVYTKLAPTVKLKEGKLSLTNQIPIWRLPLYVLDLVFVTPLADVVIATHTPTTVPTLLIRLLRKTRHHAWLYMDYDEMFRERTLERWLLQHMPRYFDLLMPISQPLADQARQGTRQPVVVTGSGLARAGYFANSLHVMDVGTKFRVLYVGDNRPRKGLSDFLAAAALAYHQLPELELVIVSKEPCTVTTPVPYQLHIYPTDEALVALYRNCDLFISCSWGEGLGYPPLEAMACGTPVVLTDSIGVRDYARHEENCLIVPPQNPVAVASAMVRLAQDPALVQRLVAQGTETVRHYEWDAVIDRVEGALQELNKKA